ncbi:MAG: group 1 truncated hemoglobin [Colwellia sp.]|nr:group 1 truncated hemoglobin [Colwellia sp.]MCW9080833.1 group 1 truncated hemoglobin [Colwellia sp.]
MSLYERLGASEGIKTIVNDIVDNHLTNAAVAPRFQNMKMTPDELKHAATMFFIAGTGGPNDYQGQDMLAAHKGMNISALEFMAVLDDALSALVKNNVGQREQEEVLFILYSMRAEIILV